MLENNYLILIISLIGVLSLSLIIYITLKPKSVVEKYDTGEKRYLYYVKKGKRVGRETVFYRSGKKNKKKYYKDGVLNGKCITYYESGASYIESHYKNGKLKGEYRIYEEDGNIKEVRNYN